LRARKEKKKKGGGYWPAESGKKKKHVGGFPRKKAESRFVDVRGLKRG